MNQGLVEDAKRGGYISEIMRRLGWLDKTVRELLTRSAGGGSSNFLDPSGWKAGTGTWSYSSADAPTFVISINADVTSEISVGMRIKLTQTSVKYFIVTAVGSFSGGATLVTVYGGTDYTLANAAITSPYYSPVKAPFGFPLSPAKWTVEASDSTARSQSSPSSGTWYNLGSFSISIPIGLWLVSYKVLLAAERSSGTVLPALTTLSTANNSQSDSTYTMKSYIAGSNTAWSFLHQLRPQVLSRASKATYYLNTETDFSGLDNIQNVNVTTPAIISAVCAYL